MSNALPSKREFLAASTNPETGMPYAGLTRGRFSAAAEAFAAANADKWAEAPVVVKAPKPPKAPKVSLAKPPVAVQSHPAAAPASFDAKEVRAWAKANGHEVGQRGRIRPEVIAAFAKAGGKPVGERAKRPTPNDMPKVRPQNVGWVVEKSPRGGADTLIAYTTCASKGGCGKQVSRCTCSTGPKAPHYLTAAVAGTPLSLVKPVV